MLISREKLQAETAKKLTQMAVAQGIRGATGMTKDQLIKKLVGQKNAKANAKPPAAKSAAAKTLPAKPKSKPGNSGGPKSPGKAASSAKPSGLAKQAISAKQGGLAKSSNLSNKAAGSVKGKQPQSPASKAKPAVVKNGTSKVMPIKAGRTKPTPAPADGVKPAAEVAKKTAAIDSGSRTSMAKTEKPRVRAAQAMSGVDGPAKPAKSALGASNMGINKTMPAERSPAERDVSMKSTAKKISQPRVGPAPKPELKSRPTNPVIAGKIKSVQQQRASAKDLAFFRDQLSTSEEPKKDRLVLFVRDPYWLQAYWEITSTGVQRAKAALAEDWHIAEPVLRLLENPEDGVTGSSEQVTREIKIHGGVNNWYIEVSDPPHTFRAVIGYKAPGNRFHSIAYSNVVHTPVPGSSDHVDHNWTDLIENGDRVFSMSGGFDAGASGALRDVFEEKLSRPMNRSALSRYGTADIPGKVSGEDFVVDAELLIFGKTHRSSEVTISGEPVKLREDGTFTVRVGLPDKRQVFPVSSTSFDGTYTYTTVLAIERNTKVMEPMSMEPGEDF